MLSQNFIGLFAKVTAFTHFQFGCGQCELGWSFFIYIYIILAGNVPEKIIQKDTHTLPFTSFRSLSFLKKCNARMH